MVNPSMFFRISTMGGVLLEEIGVLLGLCLLFATHIATEWEGNPLSSALLSG